MKLLLRYFMGLLVSAFFYVNGLGAQQISCSEKEPSGEIAKRLSMLDFLTKISNRKAVAKEGELGCGIQAAYKGLQAEDKLFCLVMRDAPLMDKVMRFPLTDMIKRCKKDHGYTDEDMELLEKELRRFLYLCVMPGASDSVGMYSKHVDNLWHTFILYTHEYHAFSHLTQGSYIHHNPTRDHERPKNTEERKVACNHYAEFIKKYEATFNEEIDPIWLLDGVEEQEKGENEAKG